MVRHQSLGYTQDRICRMTEFEKEVNVVMANSMQCYEKGGKFCT